MNYIKFIIMVLCLNTALSSHTIADPDRPMNKPVDQLSKTFIQKKQSTISWPLIITSFVITGIVVFYETKDTIVDTIGCWWKKQGKKEEVPASEQKPCEELGETQSNDDFL